MRAFSAAFSGVAAPTSYLLVSPFVMHAYSNQYSPTTFPPLNFGDYFLTKEMTHLRRILEFDEAPIKKKLPSVLKETNCIQKILLLTDFPP